MQQNLSVRFMFPPGLSHGELSNMTFSAFTGIPLNGDFVQVQNTEGVHTLRVSHRLWSVSGELTLVEIHLASLT